MSAPKYAYNAKPKLSANQLAEYLTASPTRRKSIIKDAKFPKTIVVARYVLAKTAIKKHLTDPVRSHHHFTDAIAALAARRDKQDATSWVQGDSKMSIEAISVFQRASNRLGLGHFTFSPPTTKPIPLEIEGVKISVALDLICTRADSSGKTHFGGVVLLFSKGEPSKKNREDRCKVAALMALQFAEKNLSSLGDVAPKLCMVIDVIGGEAYFLKGSYKKLLGDIEHSCGEVALVWDTIKPPADYDGPPIKS